MAKISKKSKNKVTLKSKKAKPLAKKSKVTEKKILTTEKKN